MVYLFSWGAFALPLDLKRGELDSGEVYISASFDGLLMPIKFDTGADSTQLLKAPWNSNYPMLRQEQRGGASGVRYTCDVILFSSVSVEGFQRDPFEADRCDLAKGQQLFSLNFFGDSILYFDFKNNSLEINGGKAQGKLPLRTYGKGHIAIELKMQDQPYFAVFDTGAGLSSVDQLFVDRNPTAFEYIQDIDGNDGGGHKVTMKLYKIKALDIDGIRVMNEYILAFDFGTLRNYFGENTPLIVGFNIITKYNWTLDLKNRLWKVE